jgi:hypothetical protein
MTTLTIRCDDCRMLHTTACEGCIVTFICDRDPADAVDIETSEVRALRLLSRCGLVPPLRHQRARSPGGVGAS